MWTHRFPRGASTALVLLMMLGGGRAWATDTADTAISFEWSLVDRLRLTVVEAYPAAADLPAEGSRVWPVARAEWPLTHRLWLDGTLGWGAFELRTSLDLAHTPLPPGAGPTTDLASYRFARADLIGPAPSWVDLRRLQLRWRSPVGRLQAGLSGSQWGLGLVARSGDPDSDDFGDPRWDDRSLRLGFATLPFYALSRGAWGEDVTLALALDQLVRDETTDWRAGQRGWQAVVALLWDDARAKRSAGLYTTRRWHREADGGTLDVWVADLFGRLQVPLELPKARAVLEAEGALIWGEATVAANLAGPDHQRVLQSGLLARGGLRAHSWDSLLELGYASGDGNPWDDQQRAFRFDPDVRPGRLLFGELLAVQSAAAALRLADPALVAEPPHGVDRLATRGAVTNALYLRPHLRGRPSDGLEATLSVLLAWSAAQVIDPYQSLHAGGAARNLYGVAPAGRYYGTEVDVALRWAVSAGPLELVPGAQIGWLQPGPVFIQPNGATMPPAWLFEARLTIRAGSASSDGTGPGSPRE